MGKQLFLLAVGVGLILHHAYFFYGHFGFDDLHYAELAQRLLRGQFDYANQYSYRIVPIGLTALSYQLFGLEDWSSALPALLATGGILYLLYRIFRTAPSWQLALAVVFYLAMPWDVFYSDKLMPDIFVSVFGFGAWVAYHQYRTKQGAGPQVQGIWAAFALFLTFNSKGTVILLVPQFLLYLLHDAVRGRWRFWLTTTAVCILLLTLYFWGIYILTGAAFARFQAIAGTHYLNPCSYDILPQEELVNRLTHGFYTLVSAAGMLPHLAIALLGGGAILYRGKSYATALFYPATTVMAFLSINFMTISLTSYNPVCLDPRHIMLFSPIMSVCSVFTLAAVAQIFHWRTESRTFRLCLVLLSALLLLPTVRQVRYGTTLHYAEVKTAFEQLIQVTPRPVVIYGSEVSKNLGRYAMGFKGEAQGVYFRNLTALPACATGGVDTSRYLLRTWYADWHAGLSRAKIDEMVNGSGVARSPADLRVGGLELEEVVCP